MCQWRVGGLWSHQCVWIWFVGCVVLETPYRGCVRKNRCNPKRKIILLRRGEAGGTCMTRRMAKGEQLRVDSYCSLQGQEKCLGFVLCWRMMKVKELKSVEAFNVSVHSVGKIGPPSSVITYVSKNSNKVKSTTSGPSESCANRIAP